MKATTLRTSPKPPTVQMEPALPRLFTLVSLSKYLGVPPKTVRALKIPRVILGHRTKLYRLEDVLATLASRKEKAAS